MTASGALIRCTLRSSPDPSVTSRAPGPLFVISHSSFPPSSWNVKLWGTSPLTSSSSSPPAHFPENVVPESPSILNRTSPARASSPPSLVSASTASPSRAVPFALRSAAAASLPASSSAGWLCAARSPPDAARCENGRDQDRGERGDAVSFSASLRELLGLQRVLLSRW
jgi:hypothetical protein